MGEIRIVSPGKTRVYPYPICKKNFSKRGQPLKERIDVRSKFFPLGVDPHRKARVASHVSVPIPLKPLLSYK